MLLFFSSLQLKMLSDTCLSSLMVYIKRMPLKKGLPCILLNLYFYSCRLFFLEERNYVNEIKQCNEVNK